VALGRRVWTTKERGTALPSPPLGSSKDQKEEGDEADQADGAADADAGVGAGGEGGGLVYRT
jgi:hypothetical protein